MQRKSNPKQSAKTADLKARLKPISLEQPLTGSPFLALVENEPQNNLDTADQVEPTATPSGKTVQRADFSENTDSESSFNGNQKIDSRAETDIVEVNQSLEIVEPESAPSGLPKKTANTLAPRKLCKLLEVEDLDDIFSVTDLLKASSLKLYATLARLADKNGRLKIKAHELMRAAGIKGIATYYKQERWLSDLGLIEKRAKPGPHEGSSYKIYSLNSLPVSQEIIAEFNEYSRKLSE